MVVNLKLVLKLLGAQESSVELIIGTVYIREISCNAQSAKMAQKIRGIAKQLIMRRGTTDQLLTRRL